MRLQRFTPGPRRGFTLVEVMVAAALCVLILTVMSVAFRSGMDTFSHLKSTGELQERLRSAELVLRSDLTAPHFDADSTGGTGKLSGVRLDQFDPTAPNPLKPPRQGYFRIVQLDEPTAVPAGTAVADEGSMDGIKSTRATKHSLAFTVRRTGTRDTETFNVSLPAVAGTGFTNAIATGLSSSSLPNFNDPASGALSSEWAEVVYFLADPPGSVAQATPGGLPMKTLYRRVRVLLNAPETTPTNWPSTLAATPAVGATNSWKYDGLSYSPATGNLNDVLSITDPANRYGGRNAGLSSGGLTPRVDNLSVASGDDVVLTNVLSFEVRPTWTANALVNSKALGTNRRVVQSPQTTTSDYPFDDLPRLNNGTGGNTWNQDPQFSAANATDGKRVFDTWSGSLTGWDSKTGNNNAVPFLARVTGVQIKLRIFDNKNNMARQITLVQDL